MSNIAFCPYNMKNLKKWLRIALLATIFWKGYIGGLKLCAATVNNPNFEEQSAKDAFFTFNIMTPAEWICFGSAVCIMATAAIIGLLWLAGSED